MLLCKSALVASSSLTHLVDLLLAADEKGPRSFAQVNGSELFLLSVSLSQMGASCGEVDVVVCLCEAGPCTLYSEAHTPTPVSAQASCFKCLWPSLRVFLLLNACL